MFIRILYCLLLIPAILSAQDSTFVKTDITENWEAFNPDTKSHKRIRKNEQVTSLRLNLERKDLVRSNLTIFTPDQPMLLLNGKVIDIVQDSLNVDLTAFLEMNALNNFEITLYSKTKIRTHLLSTILSQYKPSAPDSDNITSRTVSSFTDDFIFLVLLILIFFAFLLNKFPKDSRDYARLINSFTVINRDETLLTSRPLSRNNLLFVAFNALLAGFLFVTLRYLSQWDFSISILQELPMILEWLFFSIAIFAFIILKYFVIANFSRLFVLGDYKNIQFYNGVRIGLGVSFLFFLVVSFIFLTFRIPSSIAYDGVIYAIITLLILRMFILFLKLLNYSNYKTYHLITYLCATEIIPFLISYKIVLG